MCTLQKGAKAVKYIVTLRETTVKQFIIESDETDKDELEQEFWEEDQDSLKQPGGRDYQDAYNSDIESIEPIDEPQQ